MTLIKAVFTVPVLRNEYNMCIIIVTIEVYVVAKLKIKKKLTKLSDV